MMSIYPYLKRHKYTQEQHQILVFNQLEEQFLIKTFQGQGFSDSDFPNWTSKTLLWY